VEEVAHLALSDIDLKRRMLLIQDGKGAKDRIVYISNDALHTLLDYLRVRPANKVKKVFLVEKGHSPGNPSPSAASKSGWNITHAKQT